VCAFARRADEVMAPHPLAWGQGAGSPFERLTAMDAGLLLLGVGFKALGGSARRGLNTRFPAIGDAYLAEGQARAGKVGAAEAVLASAGDLVPFASAYLAEPLACPAR
jgi:aminoglycoside N3'-acetyltransferase